MALASAKAKVEVRVGKTTHKAKDTKHTNMIKCERCPEHPGVAMSQPRMIGNSVKLIHAICPLCEKESIVSGDLEQVKNDLAIMQKHYDYMTKESKQNKREYRILKSEVESLREAIEEQGSLHDEQIADYVKSVESANKRIQDAVAKEVEAAVKEESRGTVEALQQVQKDMKFLQETLEASDGKSERAKETAERALAIVQEEVLHIRAQLEEGRIEWGSDAEGVRKEFDETHDSLIKLKSCLGQLDSKLHGEIKDLARSFSNAEDLANERHEEYKAKFAQQDKTLESHQKTLESHHVRLEKLDQRFAKLDSSEEAGPVSITVSINTGVENPEPSRPAKKSLIHRLKWRRAASAVSQLKIQNAHSENDASPKDVAAILSKITDFTRASDASRVEIATLGGIPAIVTAMQKAIAMPNVQELGCAALTNLACNNADNRIKIANKGGIDAVVLAMKQHLGSVGVQENGCGALGNLAFNNAKNQIKIANMGSVDIILAAMQKYETYNVQENGCHAVKHLATNNSTNQSKIAAAGGTAVVERAIQLHSDLSTIIDPRTFLEPN